MVGADGALPGRIDDRAGHDDRECGPALDPRRPAFYRDLAGLGGQRLHAHVRRLPAAGRAAGRPAGPPPDVSCRPGRLHRGVAGLRPGPEPGAADRRARGPGPGRRGGLCGIAVPHHEPVHRDRRTGARHGRVRFCLRGRRQHRRVAGRPAHQRVVMALDIPGQPADRRAGLCAVPAADSRGPARRSGHPAGRGGRAQRYRLAHAGRVCRGQRQ